MTIKDAESEWSMLKQNQLNSTIDDDSIASRASLRSSEAKIKNNAELKRLSSLISNSFANISNDDGQKEITSSTAHHNTTIKNARPNSASLLNKSNSTTSQIGANAKRSVSFNDGANILDGSVMHFYGNRSLDILDIKMDVATCSAVSSISFSFIDYEDYLCKCFSRLRQRFQNANVSLLLLLLLLLES
jgi:hypothetical protein